MTTPPAPEPVRAPAGTPDPWPAYRLADARRDFQKSGDGWDTGFPTLTQHGLRWHPGKLYVVAGRPGSGKTAFLIEAVLRHVEQRGDTDKAPAAFFSYEESLNMIYLRLLLRQVHAEAARRTEPPPSRGFIWYWLRTGNAAATDSAADARRYVALCEQATTTLDGYMGRHLSLFDGDVKGGDISRLLRHLRSTAAKSQAVPSLVAIDYYQKIRPPLDVRSFSRQQQLQEVAGQLLRYAKGVPEDGPEEEDGDTGHAVPVLVGAQVVRGATGTDADTPPDLEHIREADDLANDAMGVLTLRRRDDPDGNVSGLAVAIVKNRDGRTVPPASPLSFSLHGEYSRVLDPAEEKKPTTADVLTAQLAPKKGTR